ncbi:hypothetical protein WJX81_008373 [Elliptochloris bilobata]|uniref:Glutamine amidotransferase type-2 domain-containing protein n=1 Tax=Elliptochloris bilobata TaxID=381761 RepID=A0AAW1RHJ1_9CHLO
MGYHVLAVFSGTTARPPVGLESPLAAASHRGNSFFDVDHKELERKVSETLDDAHYAAKPNRKVVRSADGENGFSMEVGPYVSYANRNGVSAVFSGEISSWPGVDMVQVTHDAFVRGENEGANHNDAAWLLDFYSTFADDIDADCTDHALSALSQVDGRFAFIVYDELQRRVWAARDRAGAQPLYWGASPDGRFMLGSDPIDLAACDPTPTAFPAGTLYASEGRQRVCSPGERGWVIAGETWPGQLLSFLRDPINTSRWRDVKAIPRLTSQGSMCGAVYRVASERAIPIF